MLPHPGKFVADMGENFEKSDPTIFKIGKLKKAKILLKQGKIDDCISTLIQGFNLLDLFKHNKPDMFKTWQAFNADTNAIDNQVHKDML